MNNHRTAQGERKKKKKKTPNRAVGGIAAAADHNAVRISKPGTDTGKALFIFTREATTSQSQQSRLARRIVARSNFGTDGKNWARRGTAGASADEEEGRGKFPRSPRRSPPRAEGSRSPYPSRRNGRTRRGKASRRGEWR